MEVLCETNDSEWLKNVSEINICLLKCFLKTEIDYNH